VVSPDRGDDRRRVRWFLGCVAVAVAAGWGGGQILAARGVPGPPRLPARVLALPSASQRPPLHRLTPLRRSTPMKIVIPAIGLRAGIESVDARPDGGAATPDLDHAQRAAWFRPGPSPGEAGPAVIVGHVDDKKSVAVFYYLTRLRPGDRIEAHREDGGIAYFTVQSLEEVPKNAFPGARVYGGTAPTLRLITCGGRWDPFRATYVDNIIVYADLTALRPPTSDAVAR
jgi:sortase family protein